MPSGGGGSSSTVQTSEPWAGQKPYLQSGFNMAQQWLTGQPMGIYADPSGQIAGLGGGTWGLQGNSGGTNSQNSGSAINIYPAGGAPSQQPAGGGNEFMPMGGPPQYYPFPTTIPYSAQTQQALAGQQTLATGANPLIANAMTANADLMGGGTNPYLDAMFNQAAGNLATNFRENVNPQIDAYYGRLGGSPMNPSMLQSLQSAMKSQYTDPMVNLATDIYGGAYNADQNRRLQALGMAPQTYQFQYAPIEQLGQVGAAQESKALEELQARMSEWQFNQNAPLDKLQQYMQLVGGANYGNTTTTKGPNPYATNPYGDIAGAAAMAGLAAMMFM